MIVFKKLMRLKTCLGRLHLVKHLTDKYIIKDNPAFFKVLMCSDYLFCKAVRS